MPTRAGSWPLVGREAELERIAGARRLDGCPGVIVHAPAGVGKSRLAREANAAAAAEGLPAIWVQATRSASTIPLGAFADVVPDDVRSDDPLELLRRSGDALRERARDRRVVLGVDDAQLLDPVSAALVLHLASTSTAFVVATVRSGASVPDAIRSLWKDAGAHRLELARLSDEAVGALVEAGLGGPVEQRALAWVIGACQGNALFARELVLGALEAGTLVRAGGLWTLKGRPPVSATLRELISERMFTLSAQERAPIELLALAEPLRVDELTALASVEASVQAEALGLISIDVPGDEVRLAHPLYGEALRGELPALRAQRLRLRLADVLQERRPLTPETAMRVARLLLDAQQSVPPRLLLDAARAALLAGDPDLGARLAELALRDGGGLAAALPLARAHTVRNRHREAEEVLAAVEAQAEAAVSGDYVEQRVVGLYWGLREVDAARAFIERAGRWADGRVWTHRLLPLRDLLSAQRSDFGTTVRVTAEVLSGGQADDETRRGNEARHALALLFTGEGGRAYELAHALRPTVPLRGYHETLALGGWTLIALETGENFDDGDAYLSRVLRDAVRADDHETAGLAAFGLAATEFTRGRYRSAARWFDEAALQLERRDTFGTMTVVSAFRVGIAAATGDAVAALDALARMRDTFGPAGPWRHQVPYVQRAEGWAAGPGAAEHFLGAAAQCEALPIFAAQLLYEALRAGAEVAEPMAALAARGDARLVRAYARHAAARDAAQLLAVADEFAAIGALRYGMEAAFAAAAAAMRAGDRECAHRAAARARELFQPDQGAAPPVFEGLDPNAATLTKREAQLVELAREGLSNAEIADRLIVSVRTVESHLYRAMNKLGVRDRRAL
ncbi:AAA family ATPase [Solirubrobacter sp. CPCC 204708]|uniref:LuxR C-terminal-related transcriptional regulator n=1 Tax=Solirubrobacter deserti TaxID=2282478 RepID=A0ABT4RK31_9ACTN|nr:LuxR family transcriptional regulator [Solirubrobacter deserti]MBE2319823.1 AAA family ATPase [Solirubrobacter deserti]MDA0138696.1 LuxR C-terminal-related transcriptional regulator [Solirubrobacter deserti]